MTSKRAHQIGDTVVVRAYRDGGRLGRETARVVELVTTADDTPGYRVELDGNRWTITSDRDIVGASVTAWTDSDGVRHASVLDSGRDGLNLTRACRALWTLAPGPMGPVERVGVSRPSAALPASVHYVMR